MIYLVKTETHNFWYGTLGVPVQCSVLVPRFLKTPTASQAAYLRAARREVGPEIHRHAAWIQFKMVSWRRERGVLKTCSKHGELTKRNVQPKLSGLADASTHISCSFQIWFTDAQVAFDGTSIGKAPLEAYAWHCYSAINWLSWDCLLENVLLKTVVTAAVCTKQ